MLFGLIVTMSDVSTAVAEMNNSYQVVAGLATRASEAGVINQQLFDRVSTFKAEVDAINGSVSVWSLGPNLVKGFNRAKLANTTAQQLAEELSAALGVVNPLPTITSTATSAILSLAVVVAGGYFLYKWATAPESYPSHLAPRYAGGHRRLTHR